MASVTKGNSVSLRTFKSWSKEDVIRYEKEIIDGITFVTKIWCRVCERNKDAILIHPTCKGPAKKAMMTFVSGTNNVTKHSVDRHLSGKAHNIALQTEAGKEKEERLNIKITCPKQTNITPATSKTAYRKMMTSAYEMATTPSMPLEHFKVTDVFIFFLSSNSRRKMNETNFEFLNETKSHDII